MAVTNPTLTDLTNTMCSVALPKHSFIWSLRGLQGLTQYSVTNPKKNIGKIQFYDFTGELGWVRYITTLLGN